MLRLAPKANWKKFIHPLGGDWYAWGDCSASDELMKIIDLLGRLSLIVVVGFQLIYISRQKQIIKAQSAVIAQATEQLKRDAEVMRNCAHRHITSAPATYNGGMRTWGVTKPNPAAGHIPPCLRCGRPAPVLIDEIPYCSECAKKETAK